MNVPWPLDGWNEIIPGLFQGGHYRRTHADIEEVVVADEFDLVVSLYKRHGHGPSSHVRELHRPIPDGRLTGSERALIDEIVAPIVEALELGGKVLVRCQAGYNRSGLVVALAMLAKGYDPGQAIDLIRRKRSPYALCNEHFVEYIEATPAVTS